MQPFLLFTIIRLFLYIYSLYFCLYFVFSFVFYLFFYTFVCSLLTLCLFTLCLCTCEPVKTILIVSLPTCHSLHTSTLQHLINRISNCVTQLKLDTGEKLSSSIFCCLSVSQSVSEASVSPDQISTFSNIYRHTSTLLTQYNI